MMEPDVDPGSVAPEPVNNLTYTICCLLAGEDSPYHSPSCFQVQNYVDFALHKQKPEEETDPKGMKSKMDWYRQRNTTNNPYNKCMSNSERSILETMGRYIKERSVIATIYIMFIYV